MQITPTPELCRHPGTLTMAPVSPALAVLLHQVQQQIIREAGECAAPDAIALRLGAPRASDQFVAIGHRVVRVEFEHGERRLQTPLCAEPGHSTRPGVWYGCEARRDAHGQVWERPLGDHVTDDFGNLVPVERQ